MKENVPSCSMLPFFFAAEPPASTPDTLLMVDMLLAALVSGLPEPGMFWAGSACGRGILSAERYIVCQQHQLGYVTAKLPSSTGYLTGPLADACSNMVHPCTAWPILLQPCLQTSLQETPMKGPILLHCTLAA